MGWDVDGACRAPATSRRGYATASFQVVPDSSEQGPGFNRNGVPDSVGVRNTCGFRDHLSSQGYSENHLALHLRHMDHLGRWLDEQGVDPGKFSQSHVEAFPFGGRADYPYPSRLSLRGLAPLLDYLRSIDLLPEPPPSVPATSVDHPLKEFDDYLRRERGLADDAVAQYHHTAS